MRKLAFAFSLAFALIASAADRRFEARSDLHQMTVDIAGDRYRVQVTDATGQTVLEASFPTQPEVPMNATSNRPDGTQLRLSLRILKPPALMASLDVVKGGQLIDSITSTWTTASRAAASRSVLAEKYPGVARLEPPIKPPTVISRVEPRYPAEAREARVSGIVIVETIIDTNGDVKDAVVLKDTVPFGLGAAAVESVRQWKFKPATLDGVPVPVLFNLTVNFKL
jgi:TonB family protein